MKERKYSSLLVSLSEVSSQIQRSLPLVLFLTTFVTDTTRGGGGVLDISLDGEVRRGPSYPDPV